MSNSYKNIVFTKHALERMSKRSISKDRIWQVIKNPDVILNRDSKNKKYLREIGGRKYQAIASFLKKEKKYLVISTWVHGEEDKSNLVWNIITLPFKVTWWLIKKLFNA